MGSPRPYHAAMTPTDDAAPRGPRWVGAAVRGLWAAVALAVARTGLLYAMEHMAHQRDIEQFRVRLAGALPGIALRATVCGLAVALLAALLARRVRRGPARWGIGLVLWIAGAALCLAFLAGWDSPDATRAVGLDTDRGRKAVAALAGGGLLLCAWLVAGLLRAKREGGAGRAALLSPAILLLGIPLAWQMAFGRFAQEMTVVEVLRSLTGAPWEVVEHHSELEPHAGVICPCGDYKIDGADMPSLVLPPPAEVWLQLEPGSGPANLVARAGVDGSVVHRRVEELEGCRVRFRVEVDGRQVLSTEIALESLEEVPGTAWADLGDPQGLPLKGGEALGLSTALLGPDGEERVPARALKVGFGGLALERRHLSPRQLSGPSAPNIVLVVQDTQRADRLSAYGYERPTSPHLERLAARGMLYQEAFATSSWTWPATASILSGLYPAEHGVTDGDSCYLVHEVETLAEVLQREGFTTAAFSCNPLIVPEKNFDQGFEFFDHGRGVTRKSHLVMPAVLEWLEAMAGTRFFLYVHLVDPHSPYDPDTEGRRLLAADVPADFATDSINELHKRLVVEAGRAGEVVAAEDVVTAEERQHISDLYDACVWTGDMWLGELLERIEALGLTGETIVVYTSDHGEEFFEHGLAEHGQSLFGELVRVPLVLAGPGIPEGVRVAAPVSNRHVAPTLARLGGARIRDLPGAIHLSRPLSRGEDPIAFSTARGFWEGRFPRDVLGLRRGGMALHWAPGEPGDPEPSTRRLLFDLGEDPGELTDLSAQQAALAEELQAALEGLEAELAARRRAPGVGAGAATLEMLQEIGYAGEDE